MKRAIYLIVICLFVMAIGLFFFLPQKGLQLSEQAEKTLLVANGAGLGKEVLVPERPKRVAFLNSSSLDLWLGAGGKKQVVAYVKFPTLAEKIYSQLSKDTVILGDNLNVSAELIIQQKPDLVIANNNSSIQAKLGDVLRQFGIPLLTIPNQSVQDTYFELALYGKMTGQPEVAAKELERIKNNVESIAQTYAGKEKPKAVLILGTTNSFSMLLPNSRQGSFLELAGGVNIAPQGVSPDIYSMPLSLEYLAQQDPDHMFFISMGEEKKIQARLNELLSESSAWNILRAVREGRVYVLPTELFSSHYGLSVDKSVIHLNRLLYPKAKREKNS